MTRRGSGREVEFWGSAKRFGSPGEQAVSPARQELRLGGNLVHSGDWFAFLVRARLGCCFQARLWRICLAAVLSNQFGHLAGQFVQVLGALFGLAGAGKALDGGLVDVGHGQ